MVSRDPQTRSSIGRIAAHESWAQTEDRTARTANGRAGFDARFEREVDPDGVLPPAERALRAQNARTAYFLRLALKSAEARRKARHYAAEAAEAQKLLGGNAIP